MIRLTTPTHTFLFDSDPTEYAKILVTYAQGNRIVMEKEKGDLTVEQETGPEGESIWAASFRLTQEETKAFSPNSAVKIQIRVLTEADEALASEQIRVLVSDVLNDEVLT